MSRDSAVDCNELRAVDERRQRKLRAGKMLTKSLDSTWVNLCIYAIIIAMPELKMVKITSNHNLVFTIYFNLQSILIHKQARVVILIVYLS